MSQFESSAQFFDPEGKRVCPHQASEIGCWWVRSGNPHTAVGYGCVCFVPPTLWNRGEDSA